MSLRVNRVQRFCLHDGPGIRTVVFLQGCPLACWWCHNPEMRAPGGPAETVGAPALVARLLRDRMYWDASGGGVTLSGGDPLVQAPTLEEFLLLLKEAGVHRAVETAGAGGLDAVRRLDPLVDLWLWDLKAVDGALLVEHVGAGGPLALDNLRRMLEEGVASIRLRLPLVAGFNADAATLAGIAAWLGPWRDRVALEILPGHAIGAASEPARGRIEPDAEVCARARAIFTGAGVRLEGENDAD